jgi:signal transduction histidine kinase
VRLALTFAAVMAIVLAATGLFLYLHMRSDLDHTLDRGLRSRAADVGALVQQADTGLRDAATSPTGSHAADVAQILQADGRVFDATPGLSRRPLLTLGQLRSARYRTVSVKRVRASSGAGPLRLLALPVDAQERHLVVVVGASLAERDQALADLGALLLVGGAGALLLASLAGYGLASAALRPVESMRRRAASISSDRLNERLPLGRTRDDLHRLGETLNDMLGRLQAGIERERAFTDEASHELRTPLTVLKTELELIGRDRPTGTRLVRSVEAAVEEADRLAQLTDDLLVLARSDVDGLTLALAEVDVADLLRDVTMRYARPQHRRRISIDAPDGLVVTGDAPRLQQALGNLVENALRYGREPIVISAEQRSDAVELHVRDAGPGFPPSFATHAFDRFTRADHGEGGAGLGLSIVRAIARSHGGDAHIAAATAGGADVWITLPAGASVAGRRALSGTVQSETAIMATCLPTTP